MSSVVAPGLAAVVAASFLGSLHCVAMCGPLVALHAGPPAQRWKAVALHQLGRAAGYSVLGAMAGAVGSVVEVAGAALAVQRAAMVLAVVGLVAWGVALGVGAARGRALAAPGSRVFSRGLVELRARKPASRALGLGLLTAALPCGWLWAFVAVALGTGAPLLGVAVMLAFWLGTLPALVGATALAAPLLTRLRARWPWVTALLVVGLAGAALLLRVPLVGAGAEQGAPPCHSSNAMGGK